MVNYHVLEIKPSVFVTQRLKIQRLKIDEIVWVFFNADRFSRIGHLTANYGRSRALSIATGWNVLGLKDE